MTVIDLKLLLDSGYLNLKSVKGIADEYRTDSFFANKGFSPPIRKSITNRTMDTRMMFISHIKKQITF